MRKYRATIHVNFINIDKKNYNKLPRLYLCLREAGWIHVEKSSFILETTDINKIWCGIGYVARYSHKVGELNSLTFHVQSSASGDFSRSIPKPGEQSGENALEEISNMKFPCP
jgi:hypothetical protein